METPTTSPVADLSKVLDQFDPVLAEVAQRSREVAAEDAHEVDVIKQFTADFAATCASTVRPAMEAVLDHVRSLGGGGLIEAHPGGEARFRSPSLVLWLSLDGEIDGEPRPDRDPYLQLDADLFGQEVHVFEGDMWRGGGGHRSGRVATWKLSEITSEQVAQELLAVARRSAA